MQKLDIQNNHVRCVKFLKKWITWIHCYICNIYHSQCNEPKLTLISHYFIFLNILVWKELWSIELPIWSVKRSEIYSVEKGRVRRNCNRDAVTYVTCNILNVNENFPPSLKHMHQFFPQPHLIKITGRRKNIQKNQKEAKINYKASKGKPQTKNWSSNTTGKKEQKKPAHLSNTTIN